MWKIYARVAAILVLLVLWVTRFKQDLISILSGLAIVFLMFDRNFYLYFLDQAAFPCGPMQPKEPEDADTHIRIEGLRPDSNVVFWAAESADEVQEDPWKAYSTNSNSGVTRTDSDGTAKFKVRKPAAYNVRMGTLSPHVHYRVCERPGMLGPVRTISV
jgi:hypothetical protein